jgi:hypothetical protein
MHLSVELGSSFTQTRLQNPVLQSGQRMPARCRHESHNAVRRRLDVSVSTDVRAINRATTSRVEKNHRAQQESHDVWKYVRHCVEVLAPRAYTCLLAKDPQSSFHRKKRMSIPSIYRCESELVLANRFYQDSKSWFLLADCLTGMMRRSRQTFPSQQATGKSHSDAKAF